MARSNRTGLISRNSAAFAGFLVVLFLLSASNESRPAYAATITVNTADDELNSDGDCALREAIQAANTDTATDNCDAGSGADSITLPAGNYVLTIAGAGEDANATGDLDITDDVMILGDGSLTTVVDGGALDSVVHVMAGSTVVLSNLTIQNGSSFGGGGGVRNAGTATLIDSTLRHNFATPVGGGVANSGSMTLLRSVVIENSASGSFGSGIWNTGTLVLTDSLVETNSGSGVGNQRGTVTISDSKISMNGGGGVLSSNAVLLSIQDSIISNNSGTGVSNTSGGTATLKAVTISGNTAGNLLGQGGAGIENGGTMTVSQSTISGNTAPAAGGISGGGGIRNFGTLAVQNTTISGNSAIAGGGGILNTQGVLPTSLSVVSSTLTDNSASTGGGIFNQVGVSLSFKNSIVALNPSGGDCSGVITTLGHNLDSDNTCMFTEQTDLPNMNPQLSVLDDNGGPTETHALLPGSPAIDAGSLDCPPPATDQRGIARPQGNACDIGAFEAEAIGVEVDTDIRPGSDTNPINLQAGGIIPVAVLGSDTFDVAEVDVASLLFGPCGGESAAPAHAVGGHLKDVNDDGYVDLLSHYNTGEAGLTAADVEACVTGELLDGTPFQGSDAITIVPADGP